MTQSTVTVEESLNVPARTWARATGISSQGKIDVPFTYKVKVVYRGASLAGAVPISRAHRAFQDGHSEVFDQTGIYRSLDTYDFKFVFGKFEPIDE
jgi:hypothetical protein